MKLKESTSIFNMGDTSSRVKKLVEVNKITLKQLDKHMAATGQWCRNSQSQQIFYKSFFEEIIRLEKEEGIKLFQNFSRSYGANSDKRARTQTNSIVKVGFANSDREVSEVGKHYIESCITPHDDIEKLLGLSIDNLVYLRQFLKLRVYSHGNSNDYFYNFRFALIFLSKHKNVRQTDFFNIIESVKPNFSREILDEIVNEYSNVVENNESFESYYKRVFPANIITEEVLKRAKAMFDTKNFSNTNIEKIFYNRKSFPFEYKDFILNLIDLVDNRTDLAFSKIQTLSKNEKIMIAFGFGKVPFIFTKNETVHDFLRENEGHPLLNQDHFHIYLEFICSKRYDLVKEYSDMCRRAFQVTGLICFENGLVDLNHRWVIEPLIKYSGDSFVLNGNDDFNKYEENLESPWFKDISLIQILNITPAIIEKIFKRIGERFNIANLDTIQSFVEKHHEKEYRNFVESKFPIEKVIKILSHISNREDNEVFSLVTDNATIPTIYEYILTIAWYHLSDKKNFFLHRSFQVSLDGNLLPLVHCGGGKGDIEIITEDYAILIEATLMDIHAQKRSEMEPVIRHATNFTLKNQSKKTQIIFIANDLDQNVLNIFRATQFVELSGTIEKGHINGLNIFAFTTNELITLLQKGVRDTLILQKINKHLDSNPKLVTSNWRTPIVNEILSK